MVHLCRDFKGEVMFNCSWEPRPYRNPPERKRDVITQRVHSGFENEAKLLMGPGRISQIRRERRSGSLGKRASG